MKYNFSNKNSFYASGCIFAGFLLKSNVANNLKNVDGISCDPEESTSLSKKTDFGLSIGLGKTIQKNQKNAIFLEI